MAGGSEIVRTKMIFHINEIKKDVDVLASKEHI